MKDMICIRPKYLALLFAVFAILLVGFSSHAVAQDESRYGFVFEPFGNADWVGMRYRHSDGETWRASSGNWVKVEEKGAMPEEGQYKITIVAEKDLHSWWAFRFNVNTGRTWRLSGGNWIDMPTVSTDP